MSHDHHHSDDLNTIVVNKAMIAIDEQIRSGMIGSNITRKVMEDIGKTLLVTAQTRFSHVELDKALTKPKQLEDGGALFLFEQHKAFNGLNHLLLIQYPADWDQQYTSINMTVLRVNEDSLKDSLLEPIVIAHKAEISRQIYQSGNLRLDRLFSLVYVSKDNLPADFTFYEEPVREEPQEAVDEIAWVDDGAFADGRRVMSPELQDQLSDLKSQVQLPLVQDRPDQTSQTVSIDDFIDAGEPPYVFERVEDDVINLSNATITPSLDEIAQDVGNQQQVKQQNWKIAPAIVREFVPEGIVDLDAVVQRVSSEEAYARACALGFVGNQQLWINLASIVLLGMSGLTSSTSESQQTEDAVKEVTTVADQFPTFSPSMQQMVSEILRKPVPLQPTPVQ